MNYDQFSVDEEFRSLATLADDRVAEIERAPPSPQSADEHDQALGEFAVYRFLRARPFLISRKSLLEELQWFIESDPQVPLNAYSEDRFTSSRHSLIRKLIHRFEFLPTVVAN
jgi:hypothetical protein